MNQLLIVEESNVYDWPFFLFANTMTVLTVDFEMVSGAHAHDKNKQYYFCFLIFAIRAISVFWRNLTRNSRVRWWVFLNTFLVCHELKIRKLAGRIFLNKFFCCSIAQFIYIGFRCRKPNLKSVTLLKVVWKFYHKGCLIIHYNIRRHSGQTVVDSQGAAEWTICFFYLGINVKQNDSFSSWPLRDALTRQQQIGQSGFDITPLCG